MVMRERQLPLVNKNKNKIKCRKENRKAHVHEGTWPHECIANSIATKK